MPRMVVHRHLVTGIITLGVLLLVAVTVHLMQQTQTCTRRLAKAQELVAGLDRAEVILLRADSTNALRPLPQWEPRTSGDGVRERDAAARDQQAWNQQLGWCASCCTEVEQRQRLQHLRAQGRTLLRSSTDTPDEILPFEPTPQAVDTMSRELEGARQDALGRVPLYQAEATRASHRRDLLLVSDVILVLGLGMGLLTGLIRQARIREAHQDRLLQAHQELEATVARRTLALETRSQQLARSNADLEQFATMASHDLKEPLRMVTSYLSLLKRRHGKDLDATGIEFLQMAVDGAQRMRDMIDSLMSFAHVTRPVQPVSGIDGTKALDQALQVLAKRIQETGATITHDPMPVVAIDAVQLSQVFQNLIGNAVKFCRGRAPQVHIGASETAEEWVFCVRDNGLGIDDGSQARMFEMFQRHHAHENIPGTGIGLATCRKIVENHGGCIWLESEVGVGTTFYFSLNKATAAMRAASRPHESSLLAAG